MTMQVSPFIESVQFPPITEVKSWLHGLGPTLRRPVIDLCQAIPDYPPAPQMLEYLHGLIDDRATCRYTPDEGLAEVRNAISAWYARRYGAYPSAEEICLTVGASQAFWLAMVTICRAGDEVIIPLPAYFDHPMALQSLGIACVWVPLFESSSDQPDVAAIAEKITSRTRAILLVSPSNPTGVVTLPETLDQLYNLARQHDIALVLDETYNAFLPETTRPHTLFSKPDWQSYFIHLASFGKTFALTGYRAGAMVAGSQVIHQALKIQDTMAVCQPHITQLAIRFGCEHLDSWVAANSTMMQQRHDRFRSLFTQPGNRFQIVTSGGFFAWVRHPWPELTGRAATRRMVEHANLLCLPGEAFGPGLENYLRLAFGNVHEKDMPAAVQRFIEISEQFK
jgi:aspartate/methionine/tyrosine aminotransferase